MAITAYSVGKTVEVKTYVFGCCAEGLSVTNIRITSLNPLNFLSVNQIRKGLATINSSLPLTYRANEKYHIKLQVRLM